MLQVCQHGAPKVITEADVLQRLRELLAAGFGEIRITVQGGYIHTLHKSITERGSKPLTR